MEKKPSTRDQIKTIMRGALSVLIKKITFDFLENYERKVNNWTLSDFDNSLIAHMVFVSSFESKSGNMFQKVAKEIAKVKYGEDNLPLVIRGLGITDDEFQKIKSEYAGDQIIITRLDLSKCQNIIAGFREKHRGVLRKRSTLTQTSIQEINKNKFEFTKKIIAKPVDLAFYNIEDKTLSILEIKAGGDLDSSNAPGNIAKMLTEYAAIGRDDIKLYFATLYNKNGEGNTWTGLVKSYLSDDMLLIGKEFWEKVLPKEISFKELVEIYAEVSKELKINDVLNELIKKVKP